ncbi:transposase [mine drainage metagenome]|uniref:Transposase n=1 Tax=mine drainage metagenome TaxID=410659 RepID=T1BKW0_9ZZZZ
MTVISNALAETTNGLYKTELIYPQGTFEGIVDLEWATLSCVDWFNRRRLHGALGMIPPAEFEANHYALKEAKLLASHPLDQDESSLS